MTDGAIKQIIHDVLDASLEADPKRIAGEVTTRLTQSDIDDLAVTYLAELVRLEITRKRATPSPKAAGPSRWRQALGERVFVGSWKWLRDCDIEDLAVLADSYRREAAALTAKAQDAQRLR